VQDVSQLVTKFADCLKAQLATSPDETAAAAAVDAQARGRRYTFRAPSCYSGPVARNRNTRLNVTLDDQYAEKLSRLAERTHTQEGTLARSLLSHALDEADPDPRHVADLLDGIPGAYERALLGRDQARAGTTTPLDDL